jgi:predicted Mrr-cat superfamily restriction endonuclease
MNLYQLKSTLHGIDRMAQFLKDNFVCIGWSRIGDLEKLTEAEIRERLAQEYRYSEGELSQGLEEVSCFVHAMQDGDYVLVAANDSVYLGDVGDYYYVEPSDSDEEEMCHRRGVTWLNSIPRLELNAEVQKLLGSSGMVTRFEHPYSTARLERWAAKLAAHDGVPDNTIPVPTSVEVDSSTIKEALEILKQAMRSDNAERRERAAIAILQFAQSCDISYFHGEREQVE